MSGYTMSAQVKLADRAAQDITAFLEAIPTIVGVVNVEDNPYYIERDVDLVVVSNKGEETKSFQVEIKGDTYYKTGNYFFETISNTDNMSEGCFLYTDADFLFYYYLGIQELHMLPMKETRKWFLENLDTFQEKETRTAVGGGHYTTVGRLVPRYRLLEEVKGVMVHSLKGYEDPDRVVVHDLKNF